MGCAVSGRQARRRRRRSDGCGGDWICQRQLFIDQACFLNSFLGHHAGLSLHLIRSASRVCLCHSSLALSILPSHSPFPFSLPMGFDLTSAGSQQELLMNEECIGPCGILCWCYLVLGRGRRKDWKNSLNPKCFAGVWPKRRSTRFYPPPPASTSLDRLRLFTTAFSHLTLISCGGFHPHLVRWFAPSPLTMLGQWHD